MKILRCRPLPRREGEEQHYRLRLQARDGAVHRARVPGSAMQHPMTLRRFLLERLGKDLIAPGVTAGELAAHLSHAMSKPAARPKATFGGLPTTTTATD